MFDEGLELLAESECLSLLAGAAVGRVGVSVGALPAIFPVNFVVADGAIYFRTGPGTKLAAAMEAAVVAFEADDFDAFEHSGWSVLAVGTAQAVTDPGDLVALGNLRLFPWPGGERRQIVRIPVEFISGRRIVWAEEEGATQ